MSAAISHAPDAPAINWADASDMQAWSRQVRLRAPDVVIGDDYLRRWWVIPRNPFLNVYLHEIRKSDDNRAGHDHPWDNRTLVIEGGYDEITYSLREPWRELQRIGRFEGDVIDRLAGDTHRLIVPEGGHAVTLFVTGPKVRDWGFWCPDRRFVPWQDFCAPGDSTQVGKGCGE